MYKISRPSMAVVPATILEDAFALMPFAVRASSAVKANVGYAGAVPAVDMAFELWRAFCWRKVLTHINWRQTGDN